MTGINLNAPIVYRAASLRFFRPEEYHVTRTCGEDVLLLPFQGVLRFAEDGAFYELHPGEYHIQKRGSFQEGRLPSDSPQYLYVHFLGEWGNSGCLLPPDGRFSPEQLMSVMLSLDFKAHSHASLLECSADFFAILSALSQGEQKSSPAAAMGDYLAERLSQPVTLDDLKEQFHYSKNHIINLFKNEFGATPLEYLADLRIQKSQWLLEATSDPAAQIARQCGYRDYVNFYKAFKERTGISPSQWREQKRRQPSRKPGPCQSC